MRGSIPNSAKCNILVTSDYRLAHAEHPRQDLSTKAIPDTLQEGGAPFRTTHWSVVQLAADGQSPEAAQQALADLCQVYWPPLYAFLRHRGYSSNDAQDLTQAFFVHSCGCWPDGNRYALRHSITQYLPRPALHSCFSRSNHLIQPQNQYEESQFILRLPSSYNDAARHLLPAAISIRQQPGTFPGV
jgi:hypothetical protein